MRLTHWRGPVVGILGGLGPAATVTFLDQVVKLTDAARDQDHVDVIVLQHGSVPDRTQAILGEGESPVPALAADALTLERIGVDLIALPCNSAHAFKDEIIRDVTTEVFSIVDLTAARAVEVAEARAAREGGEEAPPIAVFATEGSIAAGTYERAVTALGGTVWLPPEDMQRDITAIIYDQVKAGLPADVGLLEQLIDRALDAGAGVVVLGCTELSVVYAEEPSLAARPELVDSLRTLAVATIERSGRRVRDLA